MARRLRKPLSDCLAQIDSCLAQAAREGWLGTVSQLRDVRNLLEVTIKDLGASKDSGETRKPVLIGETVLIDGAVWSVESIRWAQVNGAHQSLTVLVDPTKPTRKKTLSTSEVETLERLK